MLLDGLADAACASEPIDPAVISDPYLQRLKYPVATQSPRSSGLTKDDRALLKHFFEQSICRLMRSRECPQRHSFFIQRSFVSGDCNKANGSKSDKSQSVPPKASNDLANF